MTSHNIHPDCLERLNALYAEPDHRGSDGQFHKVARGNWLVPPQAQYLAKLVREYERHRTLEIGFAYGFSALAILGGLKGREDVRHTSIDPYEETWWNGIGLEKVKEADCASIHRWNPNPSHSALPQLLRTGEVFDFVYVDGDHLFDAALFDVILSEKLLDIGGHLVIDDLWMPSIRTVISFVQANLELEEIPSEYENVAVFRKVKQDRREWWHFEPFDVDQRKGFY